MTRTLGPPSRRYQEDGRLVGSDAIFSSPNVTPPPNVTLGNAVPLPPADDGIPAPSVYYDDRGEIHNVKVGSSGRRGDDDSVRRINILYTRAGCMRSGDMHPNEQCDFVFSGKVSVWTLAGDGSTTVTTYRKHDFVKIPRGTPHVFEFVEDTVLAEWWEPQGFQCWFYKPYRDIVNQCMLEQDNDRKRRQRGLVVLGPRKDWGVVSMMLGATAVGVLGFALGSHIGKR
ncbi:hypothetical protein ACHAWF_014039 [Thalassiosira exigua]